MFAEGSNYSSKGGDDSHGSDALSPKCWIQVAMTGSIGVLRNEGLGS